jgi:putative PIN family toxin of toxin-antitoxin system
MRVVLDTNVFLIAIPPQSKYYPIFAAIKNQEFDLLVSNEILFEYTEILEQRANPLVAELALGLLSKLGNVREVKIYFAWNLLDNDPDDNKFVDCAISGRADYIVTNDHHFDILQTINFPFTRGIGVEAFLNLITSKD